MLYNCERIQTIFLRLRLVIGLWKTDGRTPENSYNKNSHCEPNGPGRLKENDLP